MLTKKSTFQGISACYYGVPRGLKKVKYKKAAKVKLNHKLKL